MKKLLKAGVGVLIVLWGLQGCVSKELQTQRYFDALTKDEVLQAGREVLLKEGDFIIDSYSHRIEATQIGVLFNTLQHEDRVLKAEENECGTNATLTISSNYGVDKAFNHEAFAYKQSFFWNQVESILDTKRAKMEQFDPLLENNTTTTFVPLKKNIRKDFSQCVNKSEFENGVIKIPTSSIGDIYYEDF